MPGTDLGAGKTAENKTDQDPGSPWLYLLLELTFYQGEKFSKKINHVNEQISLSSHNQ